jgi:hypothetical protein
MSLGIFLFILRNILLNPHMPILFNLKHRIGLFYLNLLLVIVCVCGSYGWFLTIYVWTLSYSLVILK